MWAKSKLHYEGTKTPLVCAGGSASLISVVLLLTLTSTTYGLVIGDWENSMDGLLLDIRDGRFTKTCRPEENYV